MLRTLLALPVLLAVAPAPAVAAEQTAIFAGGCFWCIEKDFQEYATGVTDVVSGYIGGQGENPTYKNHGELGFREAVKITYDDTKTDYATLLTAFFRSVDPTDGGGQFCDRGPSYSTAVYALDDAQASAAEAAKAKAGQDLGKPIATEIVKATAFTNSEDYHQDYYKKNKLRYGYYRGSCGRDKAVEKLWGDAAYTGLEGHKSS